MTKQSCSITDCPDGVVFQHVQFLATGRNHVVSYCQKHKHLHEKKLLNSKALAEGEEMLPPAKTVEDALAESAILVVTRLKEFDTKAARAALVKIRNSFNNIGEVLDE